MMRTTLHSFLTFVKRTLQENAGGIGTHRLALLS